MGYTVQTSLLVSDVVPLQQSFSISHNLNFKLNQISLKLLLWRSELWHGIEIVATHVLGAAAIM